MARLRVLAVLLLLPVALPLAQWLFGQSVSAGQSHSVLLKAAVRASTEHDLASGRTGPEVRSDPR